MALESESSRKTEAVDEDTIVVKQESSLSADGELEMSLLRTGTIRDERADSASNSPSRLPTKLKSSRSSSSTSIKSRATSESSVDKRDIKDKVAGENSQKMEASQPPKLARSASSKVVSRVAPLYDDLPDATMEAKSSFTVIDSCTYSNKFLGYTEHAMECDCSEEWDSSTKRNYACGDDSDCINRATKMECVGDCGCGSDCQNQRFQQRQYAKVSVIKTEKKGYGLRADANIRAGGFIWEYIGEVINEPQFRRRMVQYDDEGIKHFYFMSLSKGEFVDATKKGNLGRFCNHSCNPNCYVDKWVVGDKLRMGIFAEKNIKAGEELVFNYNVDRYGANPQPCYCGEPNCTGFIGGKTQTERATKLSTATIEALGIDDADGWDTTVAKKPRKKKTGEDDEDYVESVEAKSLDADGVTKVMAALMQCKEKWIAVKLLERVQRCEDEQVRNRVVKMHGYQILNSQLAAWKDDANVVLQILDILDQFPRLTRNKIIDSKIETTLQTFARNGDERVATKSARLLDEWSKLEVGYRIPRKKRDVTENSTSVKPEQNQYERRESAQERKRSRSRSKSRSPPRGPSAVSAPSGPRSNLLQRNNFYPRPRPPPFNPLPRGWQQAIADGKTYYYSSDGKTQWTRPTAAAAQPPPPPKAPSNQDVLKSIIDNIVTAKEKEREAKNATPDTPQAAVKDKKERKAEKWRSYDEDKKKKLYKTALHPSISYIMNKYKSKLPRDDLKRFAKEIADKLANSDFKSGRVEDPTKIDEKHEKKVKKYCKEFFDKAAYKHRKLEKEKAARKLKPEASKKNGTAAEVTNSPALNLDASPDIKREGNSDDDDVKMSEDEDEIPTSPTPSAGLNGGGLKRKRDGDDEEEEIKADSDISKSPMKRMKSESPCPPTPPPAPPTDIPVTQLGGSSPAEMNGDVSKRKREDDDNEDRKAPADISRSPAKRMRSNSPPTSLVTTNGNSHKRGRDEDEEEDNEVNSDASKSPAKRLKSESPLPPPPPPGPPIDTPPMQSEDASPSETPNQLHADTSFAEKSMADVLAEAQQDPGDGDDIGDLSMQDANDRWAGSLARERAGQGIDDEGNLSTGPSPPGPLPDSPVHYDNHVATSPRPWPNELTIESPPRTTDKHSPRPDAIKANL